MSEALPGFNQHLDEAQRKSGSYQGSSAYDQQGSSYSSGSQTGGNTGSSSGSQNPATTRTEQSANSPYVQQGTGQNTGMKV